MLFYFYNVKSNVYWLSTNDHAIAIGVQPVTWAHTNTCNRHRHIGQSLSTLFSGQRHQSQSTNPDRFSIECCHIAHTTPHHQSTPTITSCYRVKSADHKRVAQTTTTI